jgi:hypothetical protein
MKEAYMTAVSGAELALRGDVSLLTHLADTARRMSRRRSSGTIIIIRDLDGAGIGQAEALTSKLAARGRRVHTLVPPQVVEAAHGWTGSAALVIDLSPPGLQHGAILAAHLNVPLIGLASDGEIDSASTAGAADRSCDAIAIAARNHNDVALSIASVSPCSPDASAMNIQVDHRIVHFRDTKVDVRVRHGFLEVNAKAPSGSRHFRGSQCQIEPIAGRFLVLRDGTRRAELRGPLILRAWTRHVAAHVIRP